MPARTNRKQRVIAQFRAVMAEDGWDVAESMIFVDPVLNAKREVDVVLERLSNTGEHLVISVEVRGQRRKVTLPEVEGLIQKHSHLPTTNLVIVSWSGFTSAVDTLVKAQGGRVQTVTIIAADDVHPPKFLTKQFSGPLVRIDVTVMVLDGALESTDAVQFVTDLYDDTNGRLGSLEEFAAGVRDSDGGRTAFARGLMSHDGSGVLRQTFSPATEFRLYDIDRECFVRLVEFTLHWALEITHDEVVFDMLRHGQHLFAAANTSILGASVSIVIADLDNPQGSTMNISGAPAE